MSPTLPACNNTLVATRCRRHLRRSTPRAMVTLTQTAQANAAIRAKASATSEEIPRSYHDDMAKILYCEKTIAARISVLGRQIAQDYQDKAPLILGVLKGSFMFASDLVRAVEPCPRGTTLDFIRASSYGSATESSGEVQLKTDLNPAKVKGRHVLLVEDIVDTALTITTVSRYLLEQCGAASVATATLLDKHERRKLAYKPEYIGFVCPNEFVVGYGLDFAEEYRTLPYIGVLKPECYEAKLGLSGPAAEAEANGSGGSVDIP